MLRRVVVLGGVGLAVFAVLFASSPTAKGYTISNNDADTRSSGGGSVNVRADCPTSSILYEIGARGSSSYTSPTRLNGVCVNLTSDVTQHNTSTSSIAGTSSWGSVAGEATLTSTSCANTQAIVGAVVHKQAQGFVSGWQLMCGTLPSGSNRTTSGVIFAYPNTNRASPNQPETVQCPDGMVAVGLVAATGDIVDKFGFRCGRISGATQATVSVTSSSNITFGSTLALTATGGTGTGAISFATTGSCTVSGSTLTPTGNAGATCSVTATRAGDTNYAVQASSVQTVTIQRAANTISFTNPTTRTWSATPFNVTVSATSNIVPSVTSTTPSVCSVSGIAVTMLSSGTCSLTASQGETTNHVAAVAVVQSFTINPTGRSGFVGNSATISGTTTGTEYVVERFTTTGASTWTVPQGVTSIDYLVVGGGGGGGAHVGGGGGAGGVRTGSLAVTPSTPSTPSTLNITVGTGGAGARGGTYGDCSETNRSKSGADSNLSTITATGGGSGGTWDYCAPRSGGSGGGSGATNTAGSGNTPSTSPSQGNNGGIGSGYIGENYAGGGGGGAASVGAVGQSNRAGNGGTGVQSGITGVMSHYGGGGGGGVHSPTGTGGVAGVAGTGGLGGGGNGNVSVQNGTAGSGQANTGGGGGGAGYPSGTLGSSIGGAGGSGIVVVRYVLPTVTTPNLLGADDTGVNTDDITSTRTLRFFGNAPLTASIQLSIATASSSTDTDATTGTWTNTGSACTANSTGGEWECTTAQLAPGLYKVRSTSTTNMDGLTDTQISSTALVVNIDTTSPTIEVTRSSAGTLLVGQTETITFTLSEASSTFAADDITLSGGTISTLTTTSSTAYSVVFTPTSNTDAGTGSISVALSRFTDTAGNNNTASNALSIPYDTTRPSVTMSASPASVSSGSTSTITFTVSESVTTFTSTDVSVLLGTLTSFSGSGRTYTATFTASPSSGGTAVITVASGSITDSNTNANTSAFTLNITVTNAASSSGGRTSYLSDGTNGTNGVRYFVERFTTTGSSTWTVPQGVTTVDVLAIGGGGGAGDNSGGGGSGGGVAFQSNVAVSGTVNISVGTGGAAGTSATDHGKNGLATSFGSVSAGGGNGGRSNSGTGGASVTGSGAGGNGSTSITVLGLPGGDGPSYSITGTPTNYAGGGGGGGWISNTSGGAGGAGGGGAGGGLNGPSGLNGVAGTNGLGGGGGSGSNSASTAGAGGSGIVVVRYSVPAASTPDLDAADDTGTNTDNITSSTTLTFTGSAPVGSTVQLFVDGVSSGNTCTANSTTGAWTCDTAVLTAGDRVITAQSTTILSDSTVTSTSSGLTVTIDRTAPTVAVSRGGTGTLTVGQTETITFTLSEASSTFADGDITLSGGTISALTATSSTVYSAVFTPTINTNSGIGSISVALSQFTDTAGNNNTASNALSISYDTSRPSVTMSASPASVSSGSTSTITFNLSESVTTFTSADVSARLGTLTNFSGSGTSYNATFTASPTTGGTAVITVASGSITDSNTNANTSAFTFEITVTNTATSSGGRTSYVGNGSNGTNGVRYIVERFTSAGTTTWTVPRGISSIDYLVVGGGAGGGSRHAGGGGAGGLRSSVTSTGGGASPESAMTVTPDGSLTVTVGAGGASWTNGSNSVLGSVTSLGGGTQVTAGGSGGGSNYDGSAGTGTGNQGFNGGRGTGSGSVSNWLWAGGGGGGAGAAGSNAGSSGGNAFGGAGGAGVTNSITGLAVCYAGGGGGGYSSQATNAGTIEGGKCGSTMVGGTSPRGANATAGAVNTGSGGGGGGFDGASFNYAGGAGGSGIVVVRYAVPDVSTPDLDASDDTGTNTDNITSATTLTFTGSAPVGSTVQLFVDGVSSGNTCPVNSTTGAWTCDTAVLTTGNKVITAQSTTLLPDSTVTSTSSGLNVTIDTTVPTIQVTRSGSGALTAGQTETITFTLSEASSTFAADDITLSGGTISALTTTSSTVYSVLFTPTANTQSGTASISVALSRFTDAAGNNNTVSNTVSFTYDTARPTVSLSGCASSYAAGSTCSITITLSDAVTDLLLADFNVTRGSLSGLTASGTTRTVTYTASGPTGGTASVSLAAGAFTDANGNTSTASNTLNVDIAASNTRQMMTSLSASGVSVADNTNGASRYIVQTFAATGSTTWTPPQGVTRVDLLVVGGGGGGGSRGAGAGGAGGYIEASNFAVTPGSSYTVVTGAGGAGGVVANNDSGAAGSASSFTLSSVGLTANGGGAGLSHSFNGNGGASGTGSGAGGTAFNNAGGNGAASGTCGSTSDWCGGGGGGAGSAGVNAVTTGGNGGNGRASSISGISTTYAGGGGGGGGDSSQPSNSPSPGGNGGTGGGGNGGSPTWDGTNCRAGAGISGTTNTGGGGGGGSYCSSNVVGSFNGGGGSGGSGIVVVRYVLPATTTPDLVIGSDNGTSTTDNITSNRTLTFDGTAPATASVQLSVATATSATDTNASTGTWTDTGSACTADTTSGAWTCTTAELAPGLYKVRSKATTTMDGITDTQTSSTALVVEIDTTAPTVSSVSFTSSSGSDGTYKSGDVISLTVAFSENVAVTNSPRIALAGLSSKFATYASGSGTASLVFTYTVTSGDNDADGLAIAADSLELNSGTIRDTAANNATLAHSAVSTASAQKVDTTAPTVTIARAGSGSLKSGQTEMITFTLSEASSDFVVGDITVAGGSIGTLTTTSSTVYSVVFTPTANTQSGTGSLSVSGTKFTDTAGNNNTASDTLSITYDTAGPTVTVTRTGSTNLRSSQTDTITFTLSEASSTFAADDITVSGGSIGTLTTTSSTVYSVVFTPTANTQTGTGSISVDGAKFTDTLGNDNTASTALSISYDTAAPTVTIARAGSGSLKSGQTDTITFTLSETSANFVTSDVTVTGGAIGTLSGSGTSYTATFTPTSNTQTGTGSISVDGAKFTDTLGNDNTASTALSITYDTAAPTVTIARSGSGSLKSGQTDTITFTLSEASSDFVVGDITVAGGSIGTLTTTSSTVYSVVFTPTANTQSGTGSISIAGATFTDAIGNNNAASTALSISYDTAAPTVTITRAGSGTLKSSQTETITFTLSEASSTFAADDITISGGTIGTLTTTSSTVYSVVFTPTANTQSGTGSISVAGATFTDTLGNDNTASSTLSISYDTAAPTVTITRAGSGTLKSGQTDTITFTLSETSSNFISSDVTVTGGTIGSFTGSGTSYTATFTPTSNTQSGTGSISVDGAKFTDTIGNDNTASTALSINYDTAAPTVSNVTSSTANGTIGIGSTVSIQIAFSEAVTVTGTPQLTLETGATDRAASYTSGGGTDTLTFTYTVQSGDTSSDLEYTSTSALALNGGTIVDSVSNTASLTLPAPGGTGSLATNKAIVVASAPTQVVSVRTPLGPASGAAFSQQPRVSLQDTGGSVVTSDSSTVVTATVSSGASLVGSVTATAVNGVVTFNDLGISGTAGTAYTITYSATVSGNTLTAATQSVTPTVGTATQISVSTQPVGDTAGALLATAPVVSVLDSGNNVVTSASTSITVSSSGGTLNGTKTVSATNGLATFGDLTFAGTAGTSYTLTFTTTSLGSATSDNFSVGVGAATKLAITTQASGAAYNEAFTTQPVIEIRDAGNNKVPSAADVVTATLSSGTVLGSNNTSLNATSSSGVATFSGLGITGLPGSYTITYSSGALADTSHSISLVKAAQTITFADPTDRAWSATSFALTPTASSGLSVSLASTTTSICTVSGLDITMVTVGTCSLTATQSGNDYFNAASASSQSFDIAHASQTISFSALAGRPWSATTFDVAPTATSGLTTTIASTTSAVCTVSGTTITMVKAGTCTLTASQAGNTVYSAATTETQSFVIELATQSTFSLTSTTATFGANLTLATSGGSGSGSVTFTKVSGDCSITNTTLTPTSAGSCVVTATKAADSQYDSTSDTQTITINRAAQSTPLTLATTTVVYGQTLTLSGSGGEGTGTISYALSSGTCTLNGAVLTPGNAGSLCEIEVTRALSTNYNSFTSAPISITIQQATPTLGTLVLATKTYGDAPFAFTAPSATYNSSSVVGSWSYASAQASVATINGNTATITGGGTSAITATFSPTDSTNYTTAATTSTLTVDKAVPTFSWSNVDATYNDPDVTIVSPAVATTAATGTWTYSSADTSVVAISGTKFDVGSAGSAVITATFTPSNTTSYVSGETTTMTFTVGRANQATLGISSVTGTYGTALTLATSGGTTNGSVTWGVSNGSASDCSVTGGRLTTTSIGTCTVTAVMAGSSNYFSVSNVGTTVTINAKPIIVTATANFKTYGDNDPALTFTTAVGALVGNDTLTGALTRVAGENVGEYTINQGTVDNTNYDISYTTAKLTINAKPITVTATAKFKTYGDNDPALTFTTAVGALVGNDTLTGALTRVAGENVGEYTINQGTVDNTNYDISYTTAKLTINAKPITVTATAKFKTYGDNDPALTYTTAAGALVGNDTLAGSLTRVAGENVGEYTINQGTVTDTSNTNYDISYTTAKLTINAKPITVTAEPKTKIYNTNDPALTYTTPAGALVGNDTFTGALARVSGEQVASYPIRIGTLNNPNYLITFVDSALSITPAQQSQLTVTTATITYKSPVALQATGGTEGDLSFSIVSSGSAGCSIQNSTLSASGNAGSTCTVKATRAATTNFSEIDSATTTITVTRRAITVTGTAEEKTYGDNDPGFRFSVTAGSLHGSDSLTGTLSRDAGENVGTYTINRGSLENDNYTITYVSSQLTIFPRPITITATNKTKIFGEADPALTYTVTSGNIVNSDVISGEITRAVGETLGNYNITRGTLVNNNYAITFVVGRFQITGAPQAGFTLTASSYSVVYQQTITVQTSGGNGQGAVSYSTQNGTGSCSVAGTTVTGTTAGTCTVIATKAAEGGYLEGISNTITVTVEKADQTITFASITDHNYSPTPMAITPTSNSGAAVSIGTRTPNVCSTDDLEVQMLDSGTCTIAAEVATSRNYNAAPTVTRSFEIRAVAPFAPTITAVEPGDTTVSVTFTPGLSGGAAITTYRYSVDDGSRWTDLPSGTTSSPLVLGNLPNNVEAKVRIMAVNRVGNGARSNMRATTPVAKRSLEWEIQRNTASSTQTPNSATTVLQASQLPPAPARVTVQSVSGGRRTQVTAVRAARDANIPVTYALISIRTRTNKLLARIKVLVDSANPTTSVSVPYASSKVRISVQFANDIGISSGGPVGINITEGNTLEWTTVSSEARIKGTEVKGDLYFARGRSALTYSMQQNLKKMAATAKARGGLIYVSGFAQKGELKSSWMLDSLARARAEAVSQYLVKIGVRQWITFHGATSRTVKGWQPITGRQVIITTVTPYET